MPKRMPYRKMMVLVLFFTLLGGGFTLLARTSILARLAFSPTVLVPVGVALVVGCLVVGGGSVLALGGLASYIVHTLTHPQRRAARFPDPEQALHLPIEQVSFPTQQGQHHVRGIYLSRPGSPTTILVSPGYRRGMKDILDLCQHLWEAGHQVLAFEYHGHGSSIGIPVTLGYREVQDFLGAVAYAKKRDPYTHLGAIGYSMGAAVTIIGTAQSQEVEAIIADSAFASHWSAIELAIHRAFRRTSRLPHWLLGVIYFTTDHLLWWRAGYRLHQVQPCQEIAKIAPRPLLLIHGTNDTVVSPDDATQLYEAAHLPKCLWFIEGAEHIKGYLVDRQSYLKQVLAFFEQTLPQTPLSQRSQQVSEEPFSAAPSTDRNMPAVRKQADSISSGTPPPQKKAEKNPGHSALGLAAGRLLYRLRWPIVLMWVILLLAAVPFARAVPSVLHNSGYTIPGSESGQVSAVLTSSFSQAQTQVLVVFQAADTPVTDPAYQGELAAFVEEAHAFPHVVSVIPGSTGQDGCSTFVVLGFDQDQDTVASQIPALRQMLVTSATGPARAFLTGEPAVDSEIQMDTASNTEYAEMIALPATLFVLLLVFGTLVSAALPLILAAEAVVTALAAVYLLALHLETSIFVQSLASIIGLGLSIDYSLILLRRFREELSHHQTIREAVALTVATAGEAVLFSGLTVVIGFTGLLFMGIPVMTSFGVGGIVIASTAVLAALTLFPALLSILGTRVNALLALPRRAARQTRQGGFWLRWATMVQRRPLAIIALVLVLLVTLGWPALSLNPGLPGVSALPSASEARQGLGILHTQFPGVNESPIIILVQTTDGSSPLAEENLSRLDALTHWVDSQAHVTSVASLTQLPDALGILPLSLSQLQEIYGTDLYQQYPALSAFVDATTVGNATLLTVSSDTTAGSAQDQALIDHLRSIDPQLSQGLLIRVGGARVVDLDFNRALYRQFVWAFAFILCATYVLLFCLFRSVLLPLKAILMNMLSVAAAYGVLVFVFQQGHLQEVLGFTADGSLDRLVPLILFVVLFSLSMDYEVFLLTRIRERWRRTGNNTQAVAIGLQKTGGMITSAALLFVLVSGSFLFTSLVVTKELGLGITVSILVDATIIRSLLVPATMQVMGRWNWWPGSRGQRNPRRKHPTGTPREESHPAHPERAASRTFALFTGYPKAYWYLLLGTLLNGTATFVLPFEALYLVSARHLLVSQAATIVAMYGIGSCLSALLGGILADKIGRRPTMLSGLLCLAATTFGLAFAQDTWLMALLTFLIGFWISWYRPASNAVLADLIPQARQAQANSLIYWAYNLGMAVSPLLASLLLPSLGYTILFCVDGVGTVLFCLLIFIGLPETRPTVARSVVSLPTQTRRQRLFWRDGRFLLFTGLSFLLTSVYFQSLSTLPADMQAHGLGALQYGLAISVNGLAVILLSLPLSRLLTRAAPFKVLAASALLLGAGFGLTALADHLLAFPLYASSVLVWTLGEILFVPASATIVALLSPTAQRGLYQGVARTSWGLSACAGPLLGGLVLQTWGSALWIGCAVLGAVLTGSFLLLGRVQGRPALHEKDSLLALAEETSSVIVQTILTGKVSMKDLESDEERTQDAEMASWKRPLAQSSVCDTATEMMLSPEMEVYLAKQREALLDRKNEGG